MNHNGVSIDSPQDIVDTFAKYFASVYVSPRNVSTKDCENIFTPNTSIEKITTYQVKATIMNTKMSNAVGDDEVPLFIIQDCAEALSYPLAEIFNKSITLCEFPTIWTVARVVPIHKSGDKAVISN